MDMEPLNRSEGEIGGDLYMQGLKNFKQPEAGQVRGGTASRSGKSATSKLGQTQGYMENVPTDGVKDPIYESGEGPIAHPTRTGKQNQVYQSAESFGGKGLSQKPAAATNKFGQRQQIREDFLEDNEDEDYNESGEIDPNLLF